MTEKKIKQPKRPGTIALAILDLLKSHPEGLTIKEIRELMPHIGDGQQHLDRRCRELDPYYVIDKSQKRGLYTIYRWVSERPEGEWAYDEISKTARAVVLDAAHGRCQMCGRTIAEDKVKLHIDHKIPQSWGGTSDISNLWAICSECNEGKKNYFAQFSDQEMKDILSYKTVHERIYRLLELHLGEPVDCDIISFVASRQTPQDDWPKRVRELRYMGLQIKASSKKTGKRKKSFYTMLNTTTLPENPSKWVRQYEIDREKRNKNK